MCFVFSRQSRNSGGIVTVGIGFNMETPTAKATFAQYLPTVNYDNVFYNRTCLTQPQVNTLFQYSLGQATAAAEVRAWGWWWWCLSLSLLARLLSNPLPSRCRGYVGFLWRPAAGDSLLAVAACVLLDTRRAVPC